MANTLGEKELKTDWPIEEGLTLGENKLREKPNLEYEDSDLTISEHWGGI